MADRFIYQVAVESFFTKAMHGKLDALAKERLRDAGVSLDEPFLSVYPAHVFHRCVAIAAEAACPGAPADEAHYRVGRDHVDAFVQSYPGRMMAALARQIDPRMILEYTATFIRLGNNFTESRSRTLAATHSELWLNDVGEVPGWYRGIVQRGLELANVKGVSVTVVSLDPPPSATFDVSWSGR